MFKAYNTTYKSFLHQYENFIEMSLYLYNFIIFNLSNLVIWGFFDRLVKKLVSLAFHSCGPFGEMIG